VGWGSGGRGSFFVSHFLRRTALSGHNAEVIMRAHSLVVLAVLSLCACKGSNGNVLIPDGVTRDLGTGRACNRNGDCSAGDSSDTCCNHVCTSLDSDTQNCGACGTVCPAASHCQNGFCLPPPSPPDGGGIDCTAAGGYCVFDTCLGHTITASCGGIPGGPPSTTNGVCCVPDPSDAGTDCQAHGGQCVGLGAATCPPSPYSCPLQNCCVLNARQCPCMHPSDCDPGSVCVNGVCEATGLPACGAVGSACCGGWCGTCAGAHQCVNGLCQ
jgi:hypothetical protein